MSIFGATLTHGSGGVVRCGRLIVGRLGEWEITLSPATNKPTLKGVGAFRRVWAGATATVTVRLHPATPAPTMRKPRPKAPPPVTLTGLTTAAITIASGETDREL
jgi:hypothetical protein